MVYEYFRLLDEISPSAFVFENVFGLLTVEKGEVFKLVKERLENPSARLHYDISVFRLDAANYGVPQFRDRIIIIGSRIGKTVSSIPSITPEKPNATQFARRTVADGLRGLPPPNPSYPSIHTGRVHSNRIKKRYSELKPGERDHHTRINKLDLTKPSFTIICGSEHSGGKGHVHPIEPREVTPRESARMQTFPDDWAFSGHGRVAIRQVGNAVPPLLAFAIGNEIRSQIFGLAPISFRQGLHDLQQEHLFPELFQGGSR
jgi:DNA (cytosine-5)-methyltransferase 1